ncbi:MAG: Endoglucanase A precursor [Bacteroidetes bacterium ADurb.Bin217]|nr:MAG: Endoglucanase A precursor [Bacteroidetes bacterium ADurb.Bin217]
MKFIYTFSLCVFCTIFSSLQAQISDADYIKAGWMTTRMYGGNRSGDGPNWLIMTYGSGKDFVKDADGAYSLKGGWHDCGDHVKFGQTQFYAGYVLLLGYSAFPKGYDDFYSHDYRGYKAGNDFSWEGKKGTPNNIPDILDEVKYATDYYIRCIPNGTTFYSQVGNGNYDHKNWVTSVTMATYAITDGGEASGSRAIKKNPDDGSMVSFCGATLALMSRMYRPFDEAYADLCLQHALYAYQYAAAHKTNAGGGTIEGSFYGEDNMWQDNYVCLLAELYYATGQESYKTEALTYASVIKDGGWVLDYENSEDLAMYHLAKFGNATALAEFNKSTTRYKNAFSGGVMQVGSDWGRLRYTASACFILALQHTLNNDGLIHNALKGSVDYILGVNSQSQSFVVGFGSKAPQKPHHRNVFMNDNQNYTIPTKNKQHGYLVGGVWTGTFPDNIDNYQTSEGGIDYNAGLVGALGYINSIKSPVDQSKFGIFNCKSPQLGADKSLCGLTSIQLQSGLTTTSKTFSWQKDGVTIAGTGPNLTVTAAGTYKVTVDSLGCVTSDVIIISASIPAIQLGEDKTITGTVTLDAGVSGDGLSYVWKKNNITMAQTTRSISVSEAGTYSVTVSGTNCTSQSDEITLLAPPSIVQTTSAITIDGTKDAVYPIGTSIAKQLVGTPTATNLSGNWSALWDNTYLYVFVSITDNDKRNDSGTSWWEDDGVELFIDGNNNKATAYDANDFQWGFIWNRTTAIAGSNNPANSLTGVTQSIVATATGYTVEARIPWTTIGVSPSVGKIIGFDIAINDDDAGGVRENKIAWNASADEGWQNPSYFGSVTLTAAPPQPITQSITLTTGWNLISFNVLPDNTAISSVFASVNASIVKTDGGFYSSTLASQLQSLTTIELGKAYLVKVPANATLTVIGTVTNPTMTTQLKQGWNLVGVPATANQTILSKTNGKPIQTVKSFDGFYTPGGATNSITNFVPGKGYYIQTTAATSIQW